MCRNQIVTATKRMGRQQFGESRVYRAKSSHPTPFSAHCPPNARTMQHLTPQDLKTAASQTEPKACKCALRPRAGWESFTEDRWSAAQMRALGTLRDAEVYEPTAEEFHPQGTRYASPDAPVAVKFFPYNVCDVHACSGCHKVLLRYTEFGGYYVDHRVRELDAKLVLG